jgi:pyruvate/2-oxoglutarate dehydrogenase complex dihydrolipoamide acyltransferase (E2) component
MEGPGAAVEVALGDVVVVVGVAGTVRFAAASAGGAASTAPANESNPAAASTPKARARNARRLFIASTLPQSQMQDALPQGAVLLDTPQLHRQGPPAMRVA